MLISQQTLVAVILGDRKIIKRSIGYAAGFSCYYLGGEGAGRSLAGTAFKARV